MKPILAVLAGLVALGVIIAIIAVAWWGTTYNSLVLTQEQVKESCGQVQNVCQRRSDLIPNLVAVVKGYAGHENSTLVEVIKARQQITQINVGDLMKNPEAQKQFMAAQGQLSGALQRLMVVAEAYPNLKANENFRDLQTQLEGTENRITVERMRWQQDTKAYNMLVRGFLTHIVADHNGFTVLPYFEAEKGAATAPKISFEKSSAILP